MSLLQQTVCACTGPCQEELDQWCAAVKPGEGRLANCLGGELSVEGQAGHKGAKISDACKKELTSFKIERSTNINMDIPLAKACKADAEKYCANKYEVGPVSTAPTSDQQSVPSQVSMRSSCCELHTIPEHECLSFWCYGDAGNMRRVPNAIIGMMLSC